MSLSAARTETRAIRIIWALPLGYGLLCLALWAGSAPLPQDPAYHLFADTRSLWGLPNFADVVSNGVFLLAGLLGLWPLIQPAGGRLAGREGTAPLALFFTAVALTTFTSAYYHLAPDNARLVWDRVTLATATTLLPVILLPRGVGTAPSLWLAKALWVAAGPLSALLWYASEAGGDGDLRFYSLAQGYAMLMALICLFAFPAHRPHRPWVLAAFAAYLLARATEVWDQPIFAALQLVSGHTLKHLLMGLAVALLARLARPAR